MRGRIGIALGTHWGSIAQALDVIALMGALGAIGTLPALIDALARYARLALGRLQGLPWLAVRHR